jgi:hypothetical protein
MMSSSPNANSSSSDAGRLSATLTVAGGAACATAPDEQDYVHYYYVVKPLGVSLIEDLAGVDLSIRNTSGVDRVKA